MFQWNDLKIFLECENIQFLSGIINYFSLTQTSFSKNNADIVFSIYDYNQQMLPPLKEDCRLVKTIDFFLEKNFQLNIYSDEKALWYFYGDIAEIWIDYKNNRIILQLNKALFDFKYYNLLFFFLYPLAKLFENFGYYSLHSSCITINNKALFFTGNSGSGKSTSAFAIAASGGSIISDDLTFVKKHGPSFYANSLTPLVKLNEEALKDFFPQFLKYQLFKSENNDVYINKKNLSREINGPIPLSAICILNKSGNKLSDFRQVHPLKIIPHLFPSSIFTNIENIAKRKFNFITELLENISCYYINFGTEMSDFYQNMNKILSEKINE